MKINARWLTQAAPPSTARTKKIGCVCHGLGQFFFFLSFFFFFFFSSRSEPNQVTWLHLSQSCAQRLEGMGSHESRCSAVVTVFRLQQWYNEWTPFMWWILLSQMWVYTQQTIRSKEIWTKKFLDVFNLLTSFQVEQHPSKATDRILLHTLNISQV